MTTWQKYAAEVYGTYVLVALGTGAIISTGNVVGIALGFGLALVVALYTVGHVSGGHFNPAVSLAMFFDKRITATDLIGYWVSQLVGAALASLTIAWILTTDFVAQTVNALGRPTVDALGGVVGEAVLTAVFVLTILVVTRVASEVKYLAIGFALAAVHLIGVPITGASVNPARSFGPALVSAEWGDFWVYLAGPAIGALVAWVLFSAVFSARRSGGGM